MCISMGIHISLSIWVSYFWFLISCQVTVESQAYHKSCFKCSHGGCPITPSNYAALEGILYCKHHFSQLFKEKGSYNHLIKCASIKRTAATATPVPELWPHSPVYGTILSVVLLSLCLMENYQFGSLVCFVLLCWRAFSYGALNEPLILCADSCDLHFVWHLQMCICKCNLNYIIYERVCLQLICIFYVDPMAWYDC